MSISSNYDRPQRVRGTGVKLVVFWALVGIPLLWGVANTIGDATKLFR